MYETIRHLPISLTPSPLRHLVRHPAKVTGNLLMPHPEDCKKSCQAFANWRPKLILGQLCGLEYHYPILLMRKLRLWKMKACIQAQEVGILSWLPTCFLPHYGPLLPLPWFPAASSVTAAITAPPLPVSASSFIPVHTSQLWPLSSLLKTLSGFSSPTGKVQTPSLVFKTLYHLLPMRIRLCPYFHSSLLCMLHSQPHRLTVGLCECDICQLTDCSCVSSLLSSLLGLAPSCFPWLSPPRPFSALPHLPGWILLCLPRAFVILCYGPQSIIPRVCDSLNMSLNIRDSGIIFAAPGLIQGLMHILFSVNICWMDKCIREWVIKHSPRLLNVSPILFLMWQNLSNKRQQAPPPVPTPHTEDAHRPSRHGMYRPRTGKKWQ